MRRVALVLAMLYALVSAPVPILVGSGAAAGLSPAVEDCYAHAQLTRRYTVTQLRGALTSMPVDVKEYSNCTDLIQRALLAEVSGLRDHTGSGQGGGSFLPSWLIVVLALLAGGGAAFGMYARHQRGR